MHQRQVEEQGLQVRDVGVAVELACDRAHGDGARLRVRRMCLLRAAVDVAWELVQQDDQRETAPWRLRPVVQPVGACPLHERAKSRPDLSVEGVAGPEPFLAGVRCVKPEAEDFVDFWVEC